MYPSEFCFIPEDACSSTVWECINKIQYVYLHIRSAIMIHLLKMVADVSLLSRVFRLDGIEVSLDSVHTPQLRSPYILFFAGIQYIMFGLLQVTFLHAQ